MQTDIDGDGSKCLRIVKAKNATALGCGDCFALTDLEAPLLYRRNAPRNLLIHC